MDRNIIKKIFFDLFKIDVVNYGQTKVLTTAHDNDRSYLHGGKYYAPLIDTIEDDLVERNVSCISIARIISNIKGPIAYGNVYSPEGRFARAMVAKRIKGLFSKTAYTYSKMEEVVWADILDSTGAEKVFGIMPSRELCKACRDRGIWVADVQHGVIAQNHPWYGTKFRDGDPREQLPSAFLVWDQGSGNVVREWCVDKGVEIRVIGNRWISRFVSQKPEDFLVNDALTELESKFDNSEARKTILVALSWGEVGIPNGTISEKLLQVIKRTSNVYNWHLRLHPNQVKGFATDEFGAFSTFYKQHLAEHASWEVATKSPLPAVLTKIDLCIGWMTSVSMEAAQMGIKSALLDPRIRNEWKGDYFDYHHKLGFIDFIEDDEEVIFDWIKQNINNRLDPESYATYDQEYNEFLDFIAGPAIS